MFWFKNYFSAVIYHFSAVSEGFIAKIMNLSAAMYLFQNLIYFGNKQWFLTCKPVLALPIELNLSDILSTIGLKISTISDNNYGFCLKN